MREIGTIQPSSKKRKRVSARRKVKEKEEDEEWRGEPKQKVAGEEGGTKPRSTATPFSVSLILSVLFVFFN